MEHFYTLQGEGFYSGQAAYFIRLGGCDVGCVWCDVKESWPLETHPKFSVDTITSWPTLYPGKIVVITGGEPLMHHLDALTQNLKSQGLRTHIETSGAHPLSGTWDWITFSPKKFKKPLQEVASAADELKIIIFNKSDFEFAKQQAKTVGPDCKLYLQPEWDKREQMLPLIIQFVKENPEWTVSLQTHKFLDIP